jgi:hypothetical protein
MLLDEEPNESESQEQRDKRLKVVGESAMSQITVEISDDTLL